MEEPDAKSSFLRDLASLVYDVLFLCLFDPLGLLNNGVPDESVWLLLVGGNDISSSGGDPEDSVV